MATGRPEFGYEVCSDCKFQFGSVRDDSNIIVRPEPGRIHVEKLIVPATGSRTDPVFLEYFSDIFSSHLQFRRAVTAAFEFFRSDIAEFLPELLAADGIQSCGWWILGRGRKDQASCGAREKHSDC